MPVRLPAVMIGMAMEPNATGAVLASSTVAAARIGGEAERDQHDAGDRDGGAESGEGFQQAAEAERDDDALDPWVTGDPVERGPQVLEPAADHGQLIEPDRRDDDPHDREDAVHRALRGGQQGQVDRHPEGEDRHQDRRRQAGQAGDVGLDLEEAQEDEHHEQAG